MKTAQFEHQKIGTAALVKHKAFALFDEMGAGKSKQVIDAACTLADAGEIDTVVIVAPASVRRVWLDVEIGEIKKHSWARNFVSEFHRKIKTIWEDRYETPHPNLLWIITNYEFLRREEHLATLCAKLIDRTVMLVLDESSYIKNRTAAQTKAVAKLRKHCARCVLLNGTPVTQSPLDLWSQMQVLSPAILKSFNNNFYFFKSEYCNMVQRRFGQAKFNEVVSYKNLDKLSKKIAPYTLRRLKQDCLDLPEKLYTQREVALTAESWKRYQELRKDALITLGDGDKRLEPNAAVRIMRLAQLTSGILGGWANEDDCLASEEAKKVTDLSDEKLRWCVKYLTEECTAKAVIVWCRWRHERERLVVALRCMMMPYGKLGGVFELYGGQSKSNRDEAVTVFSNPDSFTERVGMRILLAQPHAGGHGLNLVAASEAIYLSNDFSLGIRLQSEDRMHRPGQNNPCLYIDVLATGPHGERTVDHTILKALREKCSVADFTTAQWRRELCDES